MTKRVYVYPDELVVVRVIQDGYGDKDFRKWVKQDRKPSVLVRVSEEGSFVTKENGEECISEETYYDYMCKMDSDMDRCEIKYKWFKCFEYILIKLESSFSRGSIRSLFYEWYMECWDAMWLENSTEYSGKSKDELLESFCGECHYVCDRVNFDRLFRTHWLFRKSGMLNEDIDGLL